MDYLQTISRFREATVSNKLPCYVYEHFCPKSGEVVYVGVGTGGRAWVSGTSTAQQDEGLRGNRHALHNQWMYALFEEGYTPQDFVRIVASRLTKKEAHVIEVELVDEYRRLGVALFNRTHIKACALSRRDRARCRRLREAGKTYEYIARKIGSSAMTVYRFLNKQTKSYGVENVK